MTLILAFGHRKKMGKDTLARFIATSLRLRSRKLNVEKRSFAAKLKSVSYSLYQWAGLLGPEYYEINPEAKDRILPLLKRTPRDIWIEMGQKLREMDQNIWMNAVLRNALPNILLIADLRFPHEADMVHELGGKVIKVIRTGQELTDDEADCGLEGYTHWDEIVEASTLEQLNKIGEELIVKYCKEVIANG